MHPTQKGRKLKEKEKILMFKFFDEYKNKIRRLIKTR